MKKSTKFLLISSFVLSGAAISTGFDVSGYKVDAAEIAGTEQVKTKLGFDYKSEACLLFTQGRPEHYNKYVYFYAWNKTNELKNNEWPGVRVDYSGEKNELNQDLYVYKTDVVFEYFIVHSNDNSKYFKSPDLDVANGNGYANYWDTGSNSEKQSQYKKEIYSFSNVRLRFQAVIPSSYFDGKVGYQFGVHITIADRVGPIDIDCTAKGLGDYDTSNKYYIGTITKILEALYEKAITVKAYVQTGADESTREYTPERKVTVKGVAKLYADGNDVSVEEKYKAIVEAFSIHAGN